MPELAILVHGQRHGLSFQPGPSLRELLDRSAYRVRSACLGHGACGLCRVRLLAGDAGPPQAAEKLQLSEAQLADGLRLACQIRPRTDLTVEIINPAAPWLAYAAHRPERHASRLCCRPPATAGYRPPVRAAVVDLGTTHISLAGMTWPAAAAWPNAGARTRRAASAPMS